MGGGLNRLDDGHMTHYSKSTGLPDGTVCSIIEDQHGNFWLGTFDGIVRVSRSELEAVAAGNQTTLRSFAFGTEHGLASSECTISGQPNVCRTPDGKLWFATTRGLAMVDPKHVEIDERPPRVMIEGVQVDGQPLRIGETPMIPPGSEWVEIRYTGISLSDPDHVRFQYRLEGHDDDWVDAKQRRTANYTNVPPGNYQFRVRASNNHGAWDAVEAALPLRFGAYYWQTVWFRIAATVLVAAAGAWLIRSVLARRYHRQVERLEREGAIERERSRIARDMHDQLGAELTQISFQSQTLSGRLDHGSRSAELAHVESIIRAADNLASGMDEVVWVTDPAKDTLESLANYLTTYSEEFFKASTVRLRLDLPLDLPGIPLPSEIRHQVLMVAKEAMTNVAKHAEAREVHLRLSVDGQRLTVVIEDDGRGLEASRNGREGNGLNNMRARIDAIGGQIEIVSGRPSGTRIAISINLEGTA